MKPYKKYLLESLSQDDYIEVEMYDLDNSISNPKILYTKTDGEGNYPLTNSGSVFFTTNDNREMLEIDGVPYSEDRELSIFKYDGSFGIYDNNFQMKYGPYKSFQDVVAEIENGEIPEEDVRNIR
jgi:hypothetical protein